MDPPVYLEDDFSHLDGLDDDVFHSDDCELVSQSSKMAFRGIFTQSKSYNCLLGRFQLFPLTHCCGPGSRHAKQQDKATQTLNASSSSQDIMLPCGVTEEPQRLFYGGTSGKSAGIAYRSSDCTEVTVHCRSVPQASSTEAPAEPKSGLVADPSLPP
ncbi:bcl-2-modifying factor isoform X2 [Pituophis catenifer annectens]|uniref:bcl-2-modifying factor isoform X2 n=1 Tax=Pituophis catenifer annectens TaxID=94852 RepID=UPI003993F544